MSTFEMFRRIRNEEPLSISWEISDRCPDGCSCQWAAKGSVPEMSVEEAERFAWGHVNSGICYASLLGGEPYVRTDILEAVTPIFPSSNIITSATSPLRWFPNSLHTASLDGLGKDHDRVRGYAGLHDRVVKNVDAALSTYGDDFKLVFNLVLRKRSYTQLQLILDFWIEQLAPHKRLPIFVVGTHVPINAQMHPDRKRKHRELTDHMHRVMGMKHSINPRIRFIESGVRQGL